MLELLRTQVQQYCPKSPHHLLSLATTSHIDNRALAISNIMNNIGKDCTGNRAVEEQAVLEMNLANYIEHLTYTLLHSKSADLLKLPLYLITCFP